MLRFGKTCFALICFVAFGGLSLAEDHSPDWKVVFQLDNDLLSGTDRDYTSGVRFALYRELDPDHSTHDLLQRSLFNVSNFVSKGFGGESQLDPSELRFSWGVGMTQLMYTGEDPVLPFSPEGERPYAGWLGAEFTLNASDSDSVGGVTLSIGTTGSNSFAEEAQEWVHENISGSPIFAGWDSQVPGELTVNLHFDHKEKIDFLESTESWLVEFDGFYEGGFALGNFRTNAYLGGLLRGGYNLPNVYATPRVELGSYGHALFAREKDSNGFSFYSFAGVRGQAVAHEITLDGPLFRDYDAAVSSEDFVGEFIFGFAAHVRGMVLSLSQTQRTREFEGQRASQKYGSIMLRANLTW